MQSKTTQKLSARKERTRDKNNTPTALKALRARLDIEVTAADTQAARQLSALYHAPNTPPIIKHVVLQIFFDLAKLYGVSYPAHCTRKWLSIWPTFIAANRKQGSLPARITYTWEPDEEESARLDAEEEQESFARHVFDLANDERLSPDVRDHIWQAVDDTFNRTHTNPMECFEVFRVAWPLALARSMEKMEEEGSKDGTDI